MRSFITFLFYIIVYNVFYLDCFFKLEVFLNLFDINIRITCQSMLFNILFFYNVNFLFLYILISIVAMRSNYIFCAHDFNMIKQKLFKYCFIYANCSFVKFLYMQFFLRKWNFRSFLPKKKKILCLIIRRRRKSQLEENVRRESRRCGAFLIF